MHKVICFAQQIFQIQTFFYTHYYQTELSVVGMLGSQTSQAASHCVGMFSLGHKLVVFVTLKRGKPKLQG